MINFPDTPTLAQIFTTAGSSWQWDGNKWEGATVAGGGPYLLLTGGTLTGQLTVNPNIVIGNAVTSPPVRSLVVNRSASTPQASADNPTIWASSDASTEILIDSYGTFASFFVGRRARGTAAAPTAIQAGDNMVGFGAEGRGSTLYPNGGATINMVALENWTDTANGTRLGIATSSIGSASQSQRVDIRQGVIIGNSAPDPGQGGLVLNANAAAPQPTTLPTQAWLAQADGTSTGMLIDGYGALPQLHLRRSAGTAAAPTAVQAGQNLGSLGFNGRGASNYFTGALVQSAPLENWSDTAQGSNLKFATVALGGTAITVRGVFSQGLEILDAGGGPPSGGTAGDMGPGTINVASGYYVNGGGAAGVALLASGNSYINSGNVGIGTTAPGATLAVNGSVALAAAGLIGFNGATVAPTTTNYAIYGDSGGSTNINCVAGGMKFSSSNVARMALGGGLTVGSPTGGDQGVGTINAVTVKANNVVLTSDAELKSGIASLPPCLPLVAAIEPKSFHWQPLPDLSWGIPQDGETGELGSPPGFVEQVNRGFIAQEVAQTLGGAADDGVDLGGMVAILWQAVRELNVKVAAMSPPPARRKAA